MELKRICRNKLATKFTWRAGAWQPPPENARADSGSQSPPWTSSFFVCALVICIMFSLLYLWKMKHEMQILTCAPLFVCLVSFGEGDKPTGRAPVGMLHSDQKEIYLEWYNPEYIFSKVRINASTYILLVHFKPMDIFLDYNFPRFYPKLVLWYHLR